MLTRSNQGFAALAVTLLLTVGASPPANAGRTAQEPDPKPIKLTVRPRATQSPGTIRVTASIERHPGNRKITIEAESLAFFRSSSSTLEGAEAPTRYTRVFAGLPPGEYEVRATVERNDGTKLLEVVMVEVFGPKQPRDAVPVLRSSGALAAAATPDYRRR